MNWLIRGDTHGRFTWLDSMVEMVEYAPAETSIIILGDAGFNFYLNKSDNKLKHWVNQRGYTIYCLRGNHEARPRDVSGMIMWYDDTIKGNVYIQLEYPNIRYLLDCGIYQFGKYRCLCIGGAYSVDKYYRLARFGYIDETNVPTKSGWFNNEQLARYEMTQYEALIRGQKVDFVFTHTCPLSFQPTDLFLGFVDQTKVDNTMEVWMENLKDGFDWNVWCFGHYHADRIERPHVEQYFHDIEELDAIWERWDRYDKTGELDWWLQKSPNFYMK